MSKLIKRNLDIDNVRELINSFPVTAILGPRQCGKTVLSKEIAYKHYFDLENPRDLAKLEQPQLALEELQGLIVIDEIQRRPELFSLIRYLVDNNPQQKYLLLGSASGELMKQSSESLAGRIAYYNLGGFRISDIGASNIKKLWVTGGFPRAFLGISEKESFIWRENYITTFLERDIPQLGITIPANTLRRFWTMLSHYHGQILNYSELGRSFGISDVTVRKYIDILSATFMVRVIQPWHVNIGKRLVKRPKIYIKDSGIFHCLISVENKKQLFLHNKLGSSWEGFALECVSRNIEKRDEEMYFWGTHTGAEMDLFWQNEGKNWGIEFKYTDAPTITKSMQVAIKDLKLSHIWIVYPGKESYRLAKNITVRALKDIGDSWDYS
ncbi:MAG: ATP-binding protein [Candidatus Omnitrophica bacterium]|nr:ATP-binding protein [Candidatus Omnitrophota bacterium]